MLQTSLLLMKSLNKTETTISVVCSLFPNSIFLTVLVPSGGSRTSPGTLP